MELKKGDTVQIMVGKDRGKKGKILRVSPKNEQIIIEGLNLKIKNVRAKRAGEKGQRVQYNAPFNASNAQLLCPKCTKPTRIGQKIVKDHKIRICRKCKEIID